MEPRRRQKLPGIIIAQQLDGVLRQEEVETPQSELITTQSKIFGMVAHTKFKKGERFYSTKDSDDKIVIGYTSDGLPFQIVVNGMVEENDRANLFKFIDEHVTPLMDEYAIKLAASEHYNDVMAELKAAMEASCRLQYPEGEVDYTLSCGITYEKNKQLFTAGFGSRYTSLNIRHQNGELKVLNHFGDNNFNYQVNPGDELLGYTFIFAETIDHLEVLSQQSVNPDAPILAFYDAVKDDNINKFQAYCHRAEEPGTIAASFGGNCMIGAVVIPSPEFRLILQNHAFEAEKNRLAELLKQMENSPLQPQVQSIYNAVARVKNSNASLCEETRDLASVNKALVNPTPENIKTMLDRAEHASGRFNRNGTLIAAGMMVLGIGLLIVGLLAAAASIAAIATGALAPLACIGIPGACFITTAGMGFMGTSAILFAASRKEGLSKAMELTARQLEKQPAIQPQLMG